MAQTIDEFSFSRLWTNPEDFPTYQGDEAIVRADMQYQPNELQTYINNTLVAVINTIVREIADLVEVSVPDGSITHAKMADDAVGTDNIQALAVTLAKMAANSVGTSQLVDAAVTQAKMAGNSVGAAQLIAGTVGSTALGNGAVTKAKLGTDILPESVGFVVGTSEPTAADFAPGQVYLKLES